MLDTWLLTAVLVFVLVGSVIINRQMNQLHLSMNSRLDELLDATRKLARAEGFKAGQENHLGALRDAGSRLDKTN